MRKEDQKTTCEFLADEVYMPGYMAITSEDYDRKGATFDFMVKEPPVSKEGIAHYLTPRGLHICIAQGSYALAENMVREEILSGLDISILRQAALAGRVKIAELNQKFRREVEIAYLRDILLEGRVRMTELYQRFGREIVSGKPVQGRFNVRKVRAGKMPVLKLDFSFGNGAITGNLVSVIAPNYVPPTNADIVRPRLNNS